MSIAFPQLTSRLRSDNATPVPPIHWPSAFVGLFLAICLVVGVSWLAAPRRVLQPLAVASAQSAAPESAPQVQPTPIPAPVVVAPEPPPVERVKVAFTNGSGVNLRARASERAQRLRTMPEGTVLEIVGADETADGQTWRNVRDTTGTSGWVSGKFVARVQP
jgi:hypothetical protein